MGVPSVGPSLSMMRMRVANVVPLFAYSSPDTRTLALRLYSPFTVLKNSR